MNSETKRRIDNARDVLVGKVPDPKSQVEQITLALMYRFMDSMDRMSEEFGGSARFFANGYERFAWGKVMDPRLGGHARRDLYADAIEKMAVNPHLPQLFRDIFRDAFLPYKDPETLRLFLKEIDGFPLEHTEDLGDAYEYLLSILSSQGDAGQFRTPRHIIKFIVDAVGPKKDETILDPACGTAGFLIHAYQHILEANTREKPGDLLTGDERARLVKQFAGYDISPDMVRLALANMYLHGFADPEIHEYDTLTSEERWDHNFDVIMANPPFMTPKGGIRPHNRFGVRSNRSEVLFVDYIAEHLAPSGRAGVVVPEGIIFQSSGAYKQLRKMLVEDSFLWAVVSLPAGVFQPYSGVKTSILFMDRELAKRSDSILFVKVANDGFDLGAQRRPIEANDLPAAQEALRHFSVTLEASGPLAHAVPKAKIAATGDYNLSGERYREATVHNHSFPLVTLGDDTLFCIESGGTPKSGVAEFWGGGVPWATLVDLPPSNFITEITSTHRTISEKGLRESSAKLIPANSVVVSTRATIGRIAINRIPLATNQGFKNVVITDAERAMPEFVALALSRLVPTMQAWATGGTFAEISKSKFCGLQIPLPPLEVQQQIVEEIEGYQKVIDGARQVVENWKPTFCIDPAWPMVELGDVCKLAGALVDPTLPAYASLPHVNGENIASGTGFLLPVRSAQEDSVTSANYCFSPPCVLYSKIRPYLRKATLVTFDGVCSADMYPLRTDATRLLPEFLLLVLLSHAFTKYAVELSHRARMPKLNRDQLFAYSIPLPPLDTQRTIVAVIEAEREAVEANRKLIESMEARIRAKMDEVWGE